jgi:hypothetical protein
VFLPLSLPHVGNLLHDVDFLDTRVLAAELLDLLALVDVPAVGRALGHARLEKSSVMCCGRASTVNDLGRLLLANVRCSSRAGLLLGSALDATLDLHGGSVSTGLSLEVDQVLPNLVGEIFRQAHLELLGEAIQNPESKVLHSTVDGIEDHDEGVIASLFEYEI